MKMDTVSEELLSVYLTENWKVFAAFRKRAWPTWEKFSEKGLMMILSKHVVGRNWTKKADLDDLYQPASATFLAFIGEISSQKLCNTRTVQ